MNSEPNAPEPHASFPGNRGDLTSPRLICAKGFLFLLGGLLASFLLILEHPTLRTALLLGLAVWCFARFYYFAFYVIEHYVDPGYRFAGLWSFARYAMASRNRPAADQQDEREPHERPPSHAP